MKLNAEISESLINLKQEAKELKRHALACLRQLDTVYTPGAPHRGRNSGNDEAIFHETLMEVVEAEHVSELLFRTISNKDMDVTSSYNNIRQDVYNISARMYRNLWCMSLSPEECCCFSKLCRSLSELIVWEDKPAKNYSRVLSTTFSGVIAFMHCYGVSFIEYNKGVASNKGWTVLQETVEQAVKLSIKNFNKAKTIMSP
jgi:hypothetical protein